MAKIILVSTKVSGTAWQLAQALQSQQHDVILLTSYGEIPPQATSGIDFMAYFKRWSLIEGLRIIPGLFNLRPQILHLILDEDRLNSAQIILSTFAKSLPTCILTTSLLNIRRGLGRRNPVRYLIEESDIITCPTIEALGLVRGLNIKSMRQGRGILPPALNLQNSQHSKPDLISDEEEQALVAPFISQAPFVVVPFLESGFDRESESLQRIRRLAQKYKVILWGSYSHWSLRDRKKFAAWMKEFGCEKNWAVTGDMTAYQGQLLLKNSSALFLAGHNLSPIEITEYYLRAIQSHTALILDSRQTSVHADLWKDSINCWVLSYQDLDRDLIKLLDRPDLRLPENLSEKLAQNRNPIDSSMNELNRLYYKALNQP